MVASGCEQEMKIDSTIEICLNCPYADCIDDQYCDLIRKPTEIQLLHRQEMLEDIANWLEQESAISTTRIREKFSLPRNEIPSLVRQGRLEAIRAGNGAMPYRIIGVNLDV